ncbi:branched-chain amino acid ABC transporter permease [Sporanaerobacter acetigenes]|uniref:branched-chain amino acid ABC transporter permease n=1 Tax=Sporanaerobacter acetigenes TaxID=165813 RepID=UPI003323DEBB
MNVVYFIQQTLNGLTIGIIYGLIALGFSMVYKAVGCLNFCHTVSVMLGAFLSYTFIVDFSFSPWLTFFLVIILLLVYGWAVNHFFFRYFTNTSKTIFMLVAISLSGVLQQAALIIWGPEARAIPNILGAGNIDIAGAVFPVQSLLLFLISLLSLIVLLLFFNRTKFGLSMRIAAEDSEAASLMGVNVELTRSATFAITALLGGIAGFLIAPLFGVTIDIGQSLALKMFVAAVVGGVGYLPGAIGAGVLVGILESLSSAYISSGWRDLIIFTAGIAVLAVRPLGIFRKSVTKH